MWHNSLTDGDSPYSLSKPVFAQCTHLIRLSAPRERNQSWRAETSRKTDWAHHKEDFVIVLPKVAAGYLRISSSVARNIQIDKR